MDPRTISLFFRSHSSLAVTQTESSSHLQTPTLDVEISIVNHSNRALLMECLKSLPPSCRGLRWRATVIDNVSDDGSLEMLEQEFPEINVLRNDIAEGFGLNHNQVLSRVVGEETARFALVLNEDTVLAPASVSKMVSVMNEDPRLGAVGPRVVDEQGRIQKSLLPFPTLVGSVAGHIGLTRPGSPKRGWLNGCCLLLRTEALSDVGLFDERFFLFFEDADLGLRLARAGWHSDNCADATIVHYGHRSISDPSYAGSMQRQMLRSQYLFLCKHYGRVWALGASWLSRLVLAIRWGKALGAARLFKSSTEKNQSQLLNALFTYDPKRELMHEITMRAFSDRVEQADHRDLTTL